MRRSGQMAANIPVPTKDYAAVGSESGIPLGDLESVVGTLVERYRNTETITNVDAGTVASRINYKPLQHSSQIRIFLTDSSGVVQLNGTINTLTWLGLAHANVGDTLVHDAQPTQTGHRFAPVHGDPAIDPTILIGRTEDNFPLIQGIALTDQAILDVFTTEFSGGAITERLWRQTSAAPHIVRLKGFFVDEDAAEAAAVNVGYDGSFATGISGTGWYEGNEPYPGGVDRAGKVEHWYRANSTYNPLAARWLISTIDIFAPEGGVTVEYAESDEGPFHANQSADDTWRRWRDTAGYWHTEPLNDLDDGWRFLASYAWDGSQDPDPGLYVDWTKALSFSVDFDDWKFMLMELEWSPTSGSEFVLVPCNILSSGPESTTGYSAGVGRVVHFRRNNNGASYDDSKFDATRRSTGNILGFRYQFLHRTGETSGTASLVRLIITGSAVIATLRFFVGR